MRKILIVLVFFITTGCNLKYSKYIGDSYKTCMDKKLKDSGVNFYKNLSLTEELLIKKGILEDNGRESYKTAFINLLKSNTFAKNFLLLKKNECFNNSVLYTYDLFSTCSALNKSITEPIYLQNYKHLLSKFMYKGYDNEELIMDLFITTDFNNEIMRMNLLNIFIINFEIKYGEWDMPRSSTVVPN